MRKNVNSEHIEGRVYQHNLELKTVSNQSSKNFGKQFINGTIEVATDEAGLNVVPVKFLYVTEMTAKGGKNKLIAKYAIIGGLGTALISFTTYHLVKFLKNRKQAQAMTQLQMQAQIPNT